MFDPSIAGEIMRELALKAMPLVTNADANALKGLTAVVRDFIVSRIGTAHHKDEIQQPLRIVIVRITDEAGKATELWLLSDRMDLTAEQIAMGYRYRWTIELFFRWFKQILGSRHLISTKKNGITIQL